MKISCFADEISPDFSEQIRVIKDLGLKFLEIRSVGESSVMTLSDSELEKIRSVCDSERLAISCVSSPIGKDKVGLSLSEVVEQVSHACHIADILGCVYIRVFSFFNRGIPDEISYDMAREKLTMMAQIARNNGKILVMESAGDTVCARSKVARRMYEDIHCPSLLCAFDMAAFLASGDDPLLESFPVLDPFIEYVHVKDMRRGETCRVPAGEGDAHVKEILDRLRDRNLFVSLEPHLAYAGEKKGFSGEANFRKAHAALVEMLDGLGISYC